MPPLKAAFEDDAIALIKDNDHLSDLRAIKLVRGIARVPVLREGETGKKRHGDHAIAVALAHYASRMRWVEYAYTAAPAAQQAIVGGPNDDEKRDMYRPPLGAGLRGGL
jgi:phage FluMu gp28-like protein